MIKWMFCIGLCCSPVFAMAVPELKGNPEELSQYLLHDKRIVAITGRGEERVEADNALVVLAVKTKESKLQAALEKNRQIRAALKKRLETAGISPSQIQTAKYSSTPSYGWFGDKPKSYEVTNEVKVTIAKEDELSVIAGIVDSVDEVYFGNTVIKYSKKNEARTKALDKALVQVLARKERYEKELGMKLVAVSAAEHASEDSFNVRRLGQQQQRSKGYSSFNSDISQAEPALAEADPLDSSSFGELLYRAEMTVWYTVK